MGIIKKEISDFELSSGTSVTIEYNENGSVHLHIGEFRIGFSEDDFNEFVDIITEGEIKLTKMKNNEVVEKEEISEI